MVEAEEGPEAEMLHDWELGQHFCVVHFEHSFVDLAPAGADAGDVVEHGGMLPERSLFDVMDEADGAKIHVLVSVLFDGGVFGDVGWVGGVGTGAFEGCWGAVGDGGTVLRAAEDVGDEGVVV